MTTIRIRMGAPYWDITVLPNHKHETIVNLRKEDTKTQREAMFMVTKWVREQREKGAA